MKKITALVLALVLVFSISCACAASDPDTCVISTLDEVTALGVAIADKGWEPDLTICAFGYWLLSEGGVAKFGAANAGLYESELDGYDCRYYWSTDNCIFAIITNHMLFAFPNCNTKDDYAAYLLLFTVVMDAENYTYAEISLGA